MHADAIRAHKTMEQLAREIVADWADREPFASTFEVRRSTLDAGIGLTDVDDVLPYVLDACREAGLLVAPPCSR